METVMDWSKAPEGATHYTFANGTAHRWLKVVGENAWYWADSVWVRYSPGCASRHLDESEVRPDPEIIPRTGEGLPPVGVVCEHRTGHGMSWSAATVLAHGKHKVFYRDSNGDEWTRLYNEIEFRPIRTPEQIAAEEHRKAVDQLAADTDWILPKEACEAVLAAGYRKQAQP